MRCACEGSKKKRCVCDDSEMHCACEGSEKKQCACDDGEMHCAYGGSKKKQCVCDDGEMRCACEGSLSQMCCGWKVGQTHVCFGSRACCVCGNGQTRCDQKCVRSDGQVCCVHGKSQARLHANLVSPRMCASSGDHCNLLCCEESNHSDRVDSCEIISTGAKEPSESEVHGLPQHLWSLYKRSVGHLNDQ